MPSSGCIGILFWNAGTTILLKYEQHNNYAHERGSEFIDIFLAWALQIEVWWVKVDEGTTPA